MTTHYVDICAKWKKTGARIANYQMEAKEDENDGIEYTYRIIKGVSKIQGAIKVLREMEYPTEILDTIACYDNVKKET